MPSRNHELPDLWNHVIAQDPEPDMVSSPETFDEEPADVKLLWQLLHVPAIFIGFLPLFFESYSG